MKQDQPDEPRINWMLISIGSVLGGMLVGLLVIFLLMSDSRALSARRDRAAWIHKYTLETWIATSAAASIGIFFLGVIGSLRNQGQVPGSRAARFMDFFDRFTDRHGGDDAHPLTGTAREVLVNTLSKGTAGDPVKASMAGVRLLRRCVTRGAGREEELAEAYWQAIKHFSGVGPGLLDSEVIESILAGAGDDEGLEALTIAICSGMTVPRRRALIEACCAVTMADGNLDSLQHELLKSIAHSLEFTIYEADLIIRQTRTRQARQREKVNAERNRQRAKAKIREDRETANARTSNQQGQRQRKAAKPAPSSGPDHWAALNIPRTATLKEARRTWHLLAMKFHPDRYAQASSGEQIHAEAHFKELARAWQLVEEELIAREAAATGR